MRIHSRVSLVTNSSSETFSFSSLGRTQTAIDMAVGVLWLEFCLLDENEDLLRSWWNQECFYTAGSRKNCDDDRPYSKGAAMDYGPPISFHIREDGKAEWYTMMDNEEAPEEFARFVEKRMSSSPVMAGEQRSVCTECMARGLNTCPPCRL